MSLVSEFFEELDKHWGAPSKSKIRLRIIGSAALMLQTDYARGTKDSDVLETAELTKPIRERLVELAGKGSALHAKHRIYVEMVPSGLPFLPAAPAFHAQESLNARMRHFDVAVLDVVDVVVSKLKRFNASDASDIEAMVERDLVPHARLVARFRAAADARATDLPKYVRALHRVERDMLGVGETDIELPSWI